MRWTWCESGTDSYSLDGRRKRSAAWPCLVETCETQDERQSSFLIVLFFTYPALPMDENAADSDAGALELGFFVHALWHRHMGLGFAVPL